MTGPGDHPEWKFSENGVEKGVFLVFGDFVRPKNGDNGGGDRGIAGTLKAFPGDGECGRRQKSVVPSKIWKFIPI